MAELSQNFSHYTLDEFNERNDINSEKCLSLFQWNIRGMNDLNKFDSVLEFLDHCNVAIDILVLGETWLKAENTSLYAISGYQSIFSCRCSSSGGLAIYISNNLKYHLISSETHDGLHHIHIQIKIHERLCDIHGIYRPPSYDVHCFLEKLEEWIGSSNPSNSCFILGDLNIPINLVHNNVALKYKTLIDSYGMTCSNTITTRPASNNLLDHFLCRVDDIDRFRHDTIFSELSDHTQIVSTFQTSTDRKLFVITKK